MARVNTSPGPSLLRMWGRLNGVPGGNWLFGLILRLMVPYSGSIRPRVRELAPGRAQVSLADRWRVRNHLNSVHAIALANLGELTTGLAVVTALPPSVRSILVSLTVVYHKKARGTLMAECHALPPTPMGESLEYVATTNILDQNGETVCEVHAQWRLSPPPTSQSHSPNDQIAAAPTDGLKE